MSQHRLHIVLFVYGTLKRGQWNHERFCRNAIEIRPATIVGRLYQLPAGFPAVVIPEESILADGTADPLADARTQAKFAAQGVTMAEGEGDPPSPKGYGAAGWDTVHGELITIPDPTRDLPPIDRLEGFRSDGHGLYRRALVAVRTDTGVEAAWVYHMARVRQGQRLRGGVWPLFAPETKCAVRSDAEAGRFAQWGMDGVQGAECQP